MKTVKIKVADLLAHLKKNREQHKKDYAELMIDYRQAVIDAFAKRLKEAKTGVDVKHGIDVIRPTDYTDSYDNVIAMLEWTTDKEVELDRNEFQQYVQDEWSWKQAFAMTQTAYGKGV